MSRASDPCERDTIPAPTPEARPVWLDDLAAKIDAIYTLQVSFTRRLSDIEQRVAALEARRV